MKRRTPMIAALTLTVALSVGAQGATAPTIAADSGPAAQAERAGGVPQLRQEGRWLVDQFGRVVILHGLNVVWKHAPYVPPATKTGFLAADARWMRDHGFNQARIGTLWAGVEPEQGRYDAAYFRKWQRVMDLMARQKIWMQMDFHQDQWNEFYLGEGMPNWATVRPAAFSALPPVNSAFPTGYWTPELSAMFDNFWANQGGLKDAWVQAWVRVAKQWKNQPYSMGYDLINEPWSGAEWPTCLTAGCPSTYPTEYQPAMEQALAAIREIDPHNIVWFEQDQLAGGQPVGSSFTKIDGDNIGFVWHNYCPQIFLSGMGVPGTNVKDCIAYTRGRQAAAANQADIMDAVGIMNEFGATDNVEAIGYDVAAADQHLSSWSYWAYKHWDDPTGSSEEGLFTKDGDLSSTKKDKLKVLVRTYPQATAGTPLSIDFNASNGAFRYTYKPSARINAATLVFISPVHYTHGYRISIGNGHQIGTIRHGIMRVVPDGSKTVTVSIQRR